MLYWVWLSHSEPMDLTPCRYMLCVDSLFPPPAECHVPYHHCSIGRSVFVQPCYFCLLLLLYWFLPIRLFFFFFLQSYIILSELSSLWTSTQSCAIEREEMDDIAHIQTAASLTLAGSPDCQALCGMWYAYLQCIICSRPFSFANVNMMLVWRSKASKKLDFFCQ